MAAYPGTVHMSDMTAGPARLPWDDQPYSIKRFGISVTNCDSEPVQTPGCIESHGALLVLRSSDLTVLQASENTQPILGIAPQALLGCSVAMVLGEAGASHLSVFLAKESVDCNPLYLLTHPGQADSEPLDVTVHTIDGVVIVEFETTSRTGGYEPDYYALIKHSVARLQKVTTLQALGDAVTHEIRALTGLDRVMVYKFHEGGHGEVVAESRREDLPTWLGLHYPAHDIPEPAREIFRQVWIRTLRDVGAPLAEMVPLVHPETGNALTMTYCALRGASIMYTEYLHNIHVTATLTLAIRRGDKLWGLISCHHYAGPVTLPYGMRAACELLAQVVSLQHESAEDREHLAYRLQLEDVHQQLITQAAHENGLAALVGGSPSLLEAMDASGAALFHDERWWCVGDTPVKAELDGLRRWLATPAEFAAAARPVLATDALSTLYPAAAAFSGIASGLLAIPLSRNWRNLILWFRPEMIRTINWAGSPHDKPTVVGPHGPRLTPRGSFELFVESVHQRSRPWKPIEIDAALRFRMQLIEFIVSRAEQLAELNADLARSNKELDSFAYVASHDLKEPLRGIHKYAHQLAEEAANGTPQTRQRLASLMRLTVRMDGLLDSLLHFSRVGRVSLEFESIDLNEVIAEALEMVDARRSERHTEIIMPRSLPQVQGDRVRVREVFVNLLSNALKYSDAETVRIAIGYHAPGEIAPHPGWPAGVTQQVIYYVGDNGIGIQAIHVEQVFKMFKRLHGRNEYGGGSGAGLTIVKKLVERHGGTIWFDTMPGQGTTFYFTLTPHGLAADV